MLILKWHFLVVYLVTGRNKDSRQKKEFSNVDHKTLISFSPPIERINFVIRENITARLPAILLLEKQVYYSLVCFIKYDDDDVPTQIRFHVAPFSNWTPSCSTLQWKAWSARSSETSSSTAEAAIPILKQSYQFWYITYVQMIMDICLW